MKQIDECLDRAFNNQNPLAKKWRGFIKTLEGVEVFILMHYHHVVLIYAIKEKHVLHQWWEKPTDKRGLDAALEYLKERQE